MVNRLGDRSHRPLQRSQGRLLFLLMATLSLGWGGGSPATAAAAGLCPAQLGEEIEAIVSRPEFLRARWGIAVQSLAADAPLLYGREAEQYFIPASNVKLMTTAAALVMLPPDEQIRTAVYWENDDADAAVVRIVGRGDPSLTREDLADLAGQLRDRGIRQIARLIVEDQYFGDDPVHPNWEWEDVQAGYGAPVNSLILDLNEIPFWLYPQAVGQPLRLVWEDATQAGRWQVDDQTVTATAESPAFVAVGRDLSRPILHIRGQLPVGGQPDRSAVSVPDPSDHFRRAFVQILTAAAIPVGESHLAIAPTTPAGEAVAAVLSPPLAELVRIANQDSDNLHAEALLRQMGAIATATPNLLPPDALRPNAATLEAGLAALQFSLSEIGVNADTYRLADGSGLSRHNLVSPIALVQTLAAMARHPQGSVYRESLAIAGQTGTLRSRFRNTPVEGRLAGKTGGLSGISALSGYLDPPNYEPLVFSIMVNHASHPGSRLRAAIDDMVLRLAQLQDGC
ncbi:MAG: D-alanyl-D-alanine carboxypeptidase/D-alanyl-D-alanine-endopeptidase [Synechococcales bacterium]|nr:D-alanyl-D-alanine carboxypeptidase/D-alanyl-D-alanine-endopeptidase [Synechococcales bacterium]